MWMGCIHFKDCQMYIYNYKNVMYIVDLLEKGLKEKKNKEI